MRMSLETTKDLFYLALAIGIFGISGFLCWGLYEIARLLRQANDIVLDAREKIAKIEHAITSLKEKMESSMTMLTALTAGWKNVAAMFEKRNEEKEPPKRRKAKEASFSEESDGE